MGKKHNKKWFKPQKRERLKPTVGELEIVDVVYMTRERDVDDVEQLIAVCTCGEWRSSREATTIMKVAEEAKEHVASGPCRFRQHQPDENPYQDGFVVDEEDISPDGE